LPDYILLLQFPLHTVATSLVLMSSVHKIFIHNFYELKFFRSPLCHHHKWY